MAKAYLGVACISASSTSVPNPPLEDCSFLIPSLGDECGFETVRIAATGEVTFDPPRSSACSLARVPVMYPTSNSANGDMDLEKVECEGSVGVWRTKPFPGEENSFLVLLTGEVKKVGLILQLPPGFAPLNDLTFVCDLAGTGSRLSINTAGLVEMHACNSAAEMHAGNSAGTVVSLDNVRFASAGATQRQKILPNLANRSFLHNVGRGTLFGGLKADLYFAVTGKNSTDDVKLGVAVLTQSGETLLLGGISEFVSGNPLVSSLLTSVGGVTPNLAKSIFCAH